ncbi:DUF4160 domain-containing protein [Salinarimonas rosea]|uniref:DUF4160 domain-containing protein n=1 Tax=Salinarimonas rosea TaxID=552063 RepID=UPI0004912C9E|nr:DUF4160 domain-containing protein [Salinarimonas rosea]
MPTVMRLDGMRVMIHTEDHAPAHVHVFRAEDYAVIVLNCPDGPPLVRGLARMPKRRLERIVGALASRVPELCRDWESIHGDL